MKQAKRRQWIITLSIAMVATLGIVISLLVLGSPERDLTIAAYSDVIRFQADGVATLQVKIFDLSGKVVWDSSVVSGDTIDWDRNNDFGERLAYGAYIYSAQGWNASGDSIFQKNGKLALMPGDKVQLQAAPVVKSPTEPNPQVPTPKEEPSYAPLAYSHTGDFTISGYLGVGIDTPVRGIHQQSSNATFRMDRDVDGPGFFLVRTALGDYSTIWKTYQVAVRASGVDNGNFEIDDIGTGVSGAGIRRLTIDNTGRFGINTETPNATLEVHGSAANLLALYDPVAPTDAKFRVEKDGDVYADGTYYCADGAFHVGSADVAERINVSEWVDAGYVVEIDPEHPGFFRKSSSPYSTKVAGIISTSPGVILGNSFDEATDDWEDNRPVLAVTGRVPCKVSTENGPIQIGDLLVASSIPGIAMKGNPEESMGAVVGKAMEPLENGTGTIVVQVMLR